MNNTPTNSTLLQLDPLILSLSSPVTSAIHTFNFCLSLPLNIYLIILLIRAGEMDGSAFYKLNQALTDTVFVFQTPLFILCAVNVTHLCFFQLIAFLNCMCLSSRFLFQCCVCFERYLAVVHPVLFLNYKTRKYHLVIASIMWMCCLSCSIAIAINYFNFPYSAFGFLFILILGVHLFFFFSILRVLRRPGPGEKIKKDGGVSPVKKKALKFVSFSLLSFLIQFIPITCTFFMKMMVPSDIFNLAFIITININNATGILQPMLFLHQMGKVTFAGCKFNRQRAPR